MEYVAIAEGSEVPIEVLDGGTRVRISGRVHQVDMRDIGNRSLFSLLVDNSSYEVLIEEQKQGFRVLLEGRLYTIRVEGKGRHRLSGLVRPRSMPKEKLTIRAPIPGMVVSVPVTTGQAVAAGDVLIVLESMKMENEVRASQDGVVQVVRVSAGELVNGDQILLVVE